MTGFMRESFSEREEEEFETLGVLPVASLTTEVLSSKSSCALKMCTTVDFYSVEANHDDNLPAPKQGYKRSLSDRFRTRSLMQAKSRLMRMDTHRLRRPSAIAVDFHLRAAMSPEDNTFALGSFPPPGGYVDAAFMRSEPSGAAAVMRRWLLGRRLASWMRNLATFSFVAATLQLSLEVTCEARQERRMAFEMKACHLVASVFYAVCALGQLCALHWQPVFALFHFLRTVDRGKAISTLTTSESEDMDEMPSHGAQDVDPFLKLDHRSLLLLDVFALVAFVAECVHLFEEPSDQPTPMQWLWLLNMIKVWRRMAPSPGDSIAHEGFWFAMLRLLCSLFLFTHLCACIFALAAVYNTRINEPTWADHAGSLFSEVRSCRDMYTAAFYFAAYTVSSVGHGDIVPANMLERNLDSAIMIVSQMAAAAIFAEFNFLIGTASHWRAQRHQRLTQTVGALKNMRVPRALCQRVLAYQDFVWEVQKERRAKESMCDLSVVLREELQTIVYHRLVMQAPFLHKLSVEALRQIISSLRDSVHLPSDFVVARGSEGSELYFMREGVAGIFLSTNVPKWNDTEIKVLQRGDYFGEVALLTGQRRSSWVMARTYCTCSLLHKKTIDAVISSDPSCIVKLTKSMQQALNLPAFNRWDDIASRLDRMYPDLEEIWYNFVSHNMEVDMEGPGSGNVLSWTSFQALMGEIHIPDFEQKLMWVILDEDELGVITFPNFVHVTFRGTRDELAERIAREIPPTPTAIGGSSRKGSKVSNSSGPGHPAAHLFGTAHHLPTLSPGKPPHIVVPSVPMLDSPKTRRSVPQAPCVAPLRLSQGRTHTGEKGILALQVQIVEMGDSMDARLDILAKQVSTLANEMHIQRVALGAARTSAAAAVPPESNGAGTGGAPEMPGEVPCIEREPDYSRPQHYQLHRRMSESSLT
mmetsp:Transcript_48043/g.155011  ORF Transcript_48043/g.155011 Transcript_48043/m.155011 type:complete len:925 (-) Transcript_48043:45-2819(-)